jgi:hypothetical protein
MLDFLVDTGADHTLINAIDAEKLGITYLMSAQGKDVATYNGVPLSPGPTMGGIGGGIRTYEVRDVSLVLVTWERNRIARSHEESLPYLYVPEGGVRAIPNLLGRDILERFDLTVSTTHKMVELTRAAIRGTYTVSHF